MPEAAARVADARRARRSRLFWLRLALGVGLFAWLAWLVDWARIGELLLGARALPLLGALALILATRLLTTLKWQVLVRTKDLHLPFLFLLRVVFVSNFLGVFLPTGVGGDAVRMYSLSSVCGKVVDPVSSVIVDRLTGLTALLVLVILGALLAASEPLGDILVPNVLVPGVLLFAVLAVLLSPAGYRFTHWLTGLFAEHFGFNFLVRVDTAVRTYGQYPRVILGSLAVSTSIQVSRLLAVFLVALGLGIELSPVDALMLVPPALFIGMLPLSIGGFGVREGALVVLLGLAGMPATEAFAVALVVRVVTLVSHLPGGFLLIGSGLQTDRAAGRG